MSIVNVFDRNNNPATYRTAPVFSTNDTRYNTDNYGIFGDSYSIAHDTSSGSGH